MFDFLGDKVKIINIFFVMIIIAFLAEKYLHTRNLRKIPVRILVNGTRGKTSVCRIVYQALLDHGYRVVGRTTGSSAEVLHADGSVSAVKRRGMPRITELVPFIRLAASENAEFIVVECMAIQAENQKTIARHLIKPTHVVITNSFIDHVAEMGWTRNDVVWTLAQSIPRDATVYAIDDEYSGVPCRFNKVEPVHHDVVSSIPMHDGNLSLAIALLAGFGIGEEAVVASAAKAIPDIGLHTPVEGNCGALFIPSFAVNDYECMEKAIMEAHGCGRKLEVVFNNRKDREYRLVLFKRLIERNKQVIDRIYCIGDYPGKVARYFSGKDVDARPSDADEIISMISSSSKEYAFLGLGNIKGDGDKVVSSFYG